MPRSSLRSVVPSPPAAVARPEKTLAPAVLKAARVLDALAGADAPLSLAELSRVVELPKSSLHTICATLLHLKLIQRAENGQMSLGPHLMNWANAFLERSDVTREFFAAWEEMNELPEETVTLSVLDGTSVVYIACRNGSRPLGVTFRIGMRLPAPYTATGKAMLATLADADIRAALPGTWPKPLSPNGCRNLRAFLAQMPEVRERGYSIDDGEVREGMRCFGAPVFGAGASHAIAGVAVSLMATEISREMQENAGQAIRRLADRMSARLGASVRA